MSNQNWGYILVGSALAIWLLQYRMEQQGLASGAVTSDQTLTLTDRLFSPAGVAAGVGVWFLSKGR